MKVMVTLTALNEARNIAAIIETNVIGVVAVTRAVVPKMVERRNGRVVNIGSVSGVAATPFGGYKRSGLGRESGQQAIQEYMQTKSIWISTATEVPNPFVMR